MIEFPVFKTYNHLPKNYRLLWHETLDEILRYPSLPKETLNFDIYPIFVPEIISQKTLGSNVMTRHSEVITDCVVTEIWLADDLSMKTGFYYELLKFFKNPLDEGERLFWVPADKTHKIFSIEIMSLSCGDPLTHNVNPIHGSSQKDYRWLRTEIRLEFRVQKLYETPELISYLVGI